LSLRSLFTRSSRAFARLRFRTGIMVVRFSPGVADLPGGAGVLIAHVGKNRPLPGLVA